MKRLKFYRVIVAIAMMLIGWLSSLAHDFGLNGIYYNKTSDNTVAVTYRGNSEYSYDDEYSGVVVIPSSVNYRGTTYSVTSIDYNAFWGCKSLESIVIPYGVTSIGNNAFWYCSMLGSIKIPYSVTWIGGAAFRGCSMLESIVIPYGVTSIGGSAFCECESLKSIEIPNSVTSIEYMAFSDCSSLTSIEIPNSVTSIGDYAFSDCSSLTSIKIPNSVTSIGDYAFQSCSRLTSIKIPNSVTSIGDMAFQYCSRLTSIEIPNSVTSIGDYAFEGCKSLTSVVIGNSVTSIGYSAFYYCSSLTSIQIPNSVTSIGERAFYGCSSLTKITCLATNPPTIESDTFSKYSAELYVPAGCISAYQSANYWKKFYNIKEIPTLSTSIALNQTTATLKATETLTLVATVLPENATDKSVTWKSSNEDVATVDANGKVTAVAVGESNITATTTDGSNLSASCKVIVTPTLATSIELNQTEISLEATETATLVTSVHPELTTDKSVTWKSSNEAAATVDVNGVVTAIAVGEATITATTVDGSNLSALCIVTVVPTLAESIVLDSEEVTIIVPQSISLMASILPELTTDKSVTWTSSDETIAVVDANGLITAVAAGQTKVTACTNDGTNLSASCRVNVIQLAESIILDNDNLELRVTENITLVAMILPETTSNKNVIWSSSDDSVVAVDENGVVTALSLGEAIITASTSDGTDLSSSCKINVVPTLAESIAIDKSEINLEATETETLTAIVLPELATDKSIVWSSSDEMVATVDANGVVTAIALGEAIITATTTDGSNLSASCKVIVVPTLAKSITLDKSEISLEATETATLVATMLPELTTNKSLEWTSSNEAVAVVDDNGEVTAIALGEAIITATTTDGSNLSASCKVTVVPTLATSIELDKTEISLEATETATLGATVLPELTTNKSVTWTSSNEAVATVDANGVVTAIALGEAVITATTVDDSNLSATCKVTVIPTLAVSIELDQTEASVEAKSDLQLTATILPENATNKEVAWSSSDNLVATVDNTGLVTIHSAGEVIITATTTDGTNLSATCHINVYSGIDGVNGDNVIVATIGENIVVKNAKLGSVVNVYSSNGALIRSMTTTDGSVVIEAPIKGIYVVTIDGKSFKVMVK